MVKKRGNMVKKEKQNEEEILEKRLKSLENKYNDKLFSDSNLGLPEDLPKEAEREEPVELPEVPEIQEAPETQEAPPGSKIVKSKNKKQKKPKTLTKKLILRKNLLKKTNIQGEGAKKPSALEIKKIAINLEKIKTEMAKVIKGQEEIVNGLIMGLLCNAHVLVEGVPGIAKTLAIRALAAASGCSVKRIQFTVDMLPTDIIGITSYTPEKGFEVIKGPIFANFLIADEINRAPPKTQSALIEGMQEKQVTIGRKKFHLPDPFFVMATENPIENAGVYPLPEAQIDRFLFKVIMGYPKREVEKEVMGTNISLRKFESFRLKPVTTPEEIIKMQQVVQKVYLDDSIKNYILEIVRKTRTKDFNKSEFISYGSSPRASIGLFIAGKARALMQGRNYVLPEDVKHVVFDVMRHRLILSYKATIQKISPDDIIKEILDSVKVP